MRVTVTDSEGLWAVVTDYQNRGLAKVSRVSTALWTQRLRPIFYRFG